MISAVSVPHSPVVALYSGSDDSVSNRFTGSAKPVETRSMVQDHISAKQSLEKVLKNQGLLNTVLSALGWSNPQFAVA